MRATRVVLLVSLVAAALWNAPDPARALPHGCVSTAAGGLSFDVARRSAGAQAFSNTPCSFYFSPGDTFSGVGAFIVRCSSGGEVNNPDFQGGQYPPVFNRPIPQPCEPGATVTIHANQPFQGGSVVAGSADFVNNIMPSPSGLPGGDRWRYVVPPLQAPDFGLGPPADRVAPFGMATIVPSGSSVTVTIADDLVPDGSFLFKICQKNAPDPGDAYCGHGHDDVTTGDICYDGPETLSGVIPGNVVEVTLWWAPSPCPDAPTTGTLTITEHATEGVVTIGGHVVDSESATGIAAASVDCDGHTAVTDSQGAYNLTLPPGTYICSASAAGYHSERVRWKFTEEPCGCSYDFELRKKSR